MPPELGVLAALIGLIRTRLLALRHNDDGYSTEAVVVIALLVAMAIAAVAIISAKVLSKANNLSTG